MPQTGSFSGGATPAPGPGSASGCSGESAGCTGWFMLLLEFWITTQGHGCQSGRLRHDGRKRGMMSTKAAPSSYLAIGMAADSRSIIICIIICIISMRLAIILWCAPMSPVMACMPFMSPMPALDISPIIAMPSCMAFMCSAISLLRSCGVLALIILSCMACMVFICASILAIWSGVTMLLADAVPMGVVGAVLQAASKVALVRTTASGINRKWVMKDSWLG